jgi:hypothetical protein
MPEFWSDDDLDRALAELRADVPVDDAALATARTTLLAAARSTEQDPVPAGAVPAASTVAPLRADRRRGSPPHWRRWGAAAAVLALVAGGAVVVRNLPDGSDQPTVSRPPVPGKPSAPGSSPAGRWAVGSAAAAGLVYSAERVGATATPGPGEYLKVTTHSWASRDFYMMENKPQEIRFLAETVSQVWIPADRTKVWLWRSADTGRRKWQRGSEAEAKAAGIDITIGSKPETRRARCGDWFARAEGRKECTKEGHWAEPNPAWIAGLPRDPAALLKRLKADAVKNGRGDAELLVTAADALRSGVLPADVRSALYRALALLPALVVTERSTNLDGRVGVSYGIVDKELGSRQDIIVDPETGEFIGERESWKGAGGGWQNTRQYSSISTSVVPRAGA